MNEESQLAGRISAISKYCDYAGIPRTHGGKELAFHERVKIMMIELDMAKLEIKKLKVLTG